MADNNYRRGEPAPYFQALRDQFRESQPFTAVPSVELTTAQWRSIVEILLDLADLVDATCPNDLNTTLIEGKVLKDSATKAWGLMHALELDAWYANNEQVLAMAREKRRKGIALGQNDPMETDAE